mmetsp:Transcript_19533/g.23427  ORF Transcript_19533/g.23427 Transcript_19533/m.23427 type:complete len:99 (+) Transcript_19533:572-868(+)
MREVEGAPGDGPLPGELLLAEGGVTVEGFGRRGTVGLFVTEDLEAAAIALGLSGDDVVTTGALLDDAASSSGFFIAAILAAIPDCTDPFRGTPSPACC